MVAPPLASRWQYPSSHGTGVRAREKKTGRLSFNNGIRNRLKLTESPLRYAHHDGTVRTRAHSHRHWRLATGSHGHGHTTTPHTHNGRGCCLCYHVAAQRGSFVQTPWHPLSSSIGIAATAAIKKRRRKQTHKQAGHVAFGARWLPCFYHSSFHTDMAFVIVLSPLKGGRRIGSVSCALRV